jgi:uncharacterized membrane protein
MSFLLCAFLIGVVAGLRALTAPAVVSWAAGLGWIHLGGTPLHFLSFSATRYVLSVLALIEIINDKLPKTPSRKAPASFAIRIITGAFSGAALGAARGSLWLGLIAGAVGAVAGTLGGYEVRTRLTRAIGGNDLPIALLEDVIAVLGAVWIASHVA